MWVLLVALLLLAFQAFGIFFKKVRVTPHRERKAASSQTLLAVRHPLKKKLRSYP